MYIVSLVYPLTALPQVIKVYTIHSVASLSLASYLLYLVFGIISLLYAINKRIRPLIIECTLWLLVYGAIVVGFFKYS
jgi:uncharacterized protein with PQ loop repeat